MSAASVQSSVLLLVRRLLNSPALQIKQENNTKEIITKEIIGNNFILEPPLNYKELRGGIHLYYLLAHIAPQTFTAVDEIFRPTINTNNNNNNINLDNWIVRRGNMSILIQHMNDYAHQVLGAPSTMNLTQMISADDIAKLSILKDDDEVKEEINNNNNNNNNNNKGLSDLMELTDLFIVMIVLSGNSDILQIVKSLPHSDQVILSNTAKACITKHALHPRRKNETSTLGDSSHSSIIKSSLISSHVTGISTRGTRQGVSSTNDESNNNNNNNNNNIIIQLRRELDDAHAKVTELDSKLQLALTEKHEYESKYKTILAETEQRKSAFANEDHLRQLLSKKEETIKSLTFTSEEYIKKIAVFKEAIAAQETALGAMKRKLRNTEEELIKKSKERREAIEKVSLVEDKLKIQMDTRIELEKELEDVRAELAIAKARYHQEEDIDDDNNNNNNSESHLGRSFSSVNSIDRVVHLENELDEVKSQKEAAERLLHVLQRQLATSSSSSSSLLTSEEGNNNNNNNIIINSSSALEAVKSQLRQAEKEKEELRNQLTATIARLEELQNRGRGGFGSQSVIDSETESFVTQEKNSLKDINDVNSMQDIGEIYSNTPSHLREAPDVLRREQTVLASTVLLLGYRNLMLQQQKTLINSNSNNNIIPFGEIDEMENNINSNNKRVNCGSFLTRHRYEIEEGLLNSVIHRNEHRN